MASTVLNWILGLFTILFAGTNIVTLVQLKSLKQKGAYEADGVHIKNLQAAIESLRDESQRKDKRIEALENKTAECGKKCEERLDAQEKYYSELVEKLRAANLKGLNL